MGLLKDTYKLLIVAILSILVSGCGKGDPKNQAGTEELTQLHDMYMAYVKRNEQPPREFADINQKTYEMPYPEAFRAVKSGKYVVLWGVSGKDSGKVLAYDKEAPDNGGLVVMADGTVKTMTADELKAAIKQ